MSTRLQAINNTLKPAEASRLKQARDQTVLNSQELKDIIFGSGNFDNYVKPTLDYINENRHIFTQPNI